MGGLRENHPRPSDSSSPWQLSLTSSVVLDELKTKRELTPSPQTATISQQKQHRHDNSHPPRLRKDHTCGAYHSLPPFLPSTWHPDQKARCKNTLSRRADKGTSLQAGLIDRARTRRGSGTVVCLCKEHVFSTPAASAAWLAHRSTAPSFGALHTPYCSRPLPRHRRVCRVCPCCALPCIKTSQVCVCGYSGHLTSAAGDGHIDRGADVAPVGDNTPPMIPSKLSGPARGFGWLCGDCSKKRGGHGGSGPSAGNKVLLPRCSQLDQGVVAHVSVPASATAPRQHGSVTKS